VSSRAKFFKLHVKKINLVAVINIFKRKLENIIMHCIKQKKGPFLDPLGSVMCVCVYYFRFLVVKGTLFGVARVWAQGLELARQVLSHLHQTSIPKDKPLFWAQRRLEGFLKHYFAFSDVTGSQACDVSLGSFRIFLCSEMTLLSLCSTYYCAEVELLQAGIPLKTSLGSTRCRSVFILDN
jgi:hypothetical protein